MATTPRACNGYSDLTPFSGPYAGPSYNGSGFEVPLAPTLPHADFGGAECCGCLDAIFRNYDANIACDECGILVRTVLAIDLQRTLDEMELTLNVCSAMCPECRRVNLFPGFSRMLVYTWRCGEAIKPAGTRPTVDSGDEACSSRTGERSSVISGAVVSGLSWLGVPEHDTFYAIRRTLDDGSVILTVLHEVPAAAQELGAFPTPGEAIDFAQEEARRLNASGGSAEYVEPPDDLVGTPRRRLQREGIPSSLPELIQGRGRGRPHEAGLPIAPAVSRLTKIRP